MKNEPVRIAHVIGKDVHGGLEAIVMDYYRNIDRSKIQYDFLIDEDSTSTFMKDEIPGLGGRVIMIPPYQKQFKYQKVLHKLFTENHYPLVYSHLNTLSVFPLFAAWRAGIPIRIAHNHSTAGKGELMKNVMKYSLRPFAKLFPTHLCACSRLAGEWLFGKRAMNSGRVTIWQNAINVSKFAYDEDVRKDVRRELNLSDKFVVGHAGRFIHQKNHDFLIDIFMEIHKRRSDSVLLLAGNGPLMETMIEKVNCMGINDCVKFLGSVSSMERYYQAMDIFILPSFYEGLPVVGSEVQVSGLPFLCSDAVTSETKFCENLHFMSLSKNAGEWAEEALKMSEHYIRRDMQKEAIEHGFDIKAQAKKMTRWYCDLLKIPC